jgi:hypothetical protein
MRVKISGETRLGARHIREIDRVLDLQLGSDSYELVSTDSNLFKLTYLVEPRYTFECKDINTGYLCTYLPGQEVGFNTAHYSGFQEVAQRIEHWSAITDDELRTRAMMRNTGADLQDWILGLDEQQIGDPSAPFSPEQAHRLSTRLDDLADRVAKLEQTQGNGPTKHDASQVIEAAKVDVNQLPRRAWMLKHLPRIARISKSLGDIVEGIGKAAETVKKLMDLTGN